MDVWARFLKVFLSDRFFKVRVGNQLSERFPQVNGVPQGGVLSVALFAVMINDIGDLISPTIGRALFVDDLAIWTGASSTRAMERQFQVAVTQLERWSAVNGLRFSTTKGLVTLPNFGHDFVAESNRAKIRRLAVEIREHS